MGKVKSAICLTLITLIIAVLCVACTVSFSVPGTVKEYHSVVSIISKNASYGNGFLAVYYPDGVISAEEYESTVEDYGSDQAGREKYQAKYSAYNDAIYLEKESVLTDDEQSVKDEFKQSFASAVKALKERFEALGADGARLEICDDYTVRVIMPSSDDRASSALSYFGYTGAFRVAYGTTSDVVIEENAGDYVKSVSSRTAQDTSYVVIEFTKAGRELIKQTTAAAAESSSTLYFMVGENTLINLSVSTQIDQDALYISGSYTGATAETTSVVLNQALNGTQTDLALTLGTARSYENGFGANTMTFIYIGFGALIVVMALFFLIRYHALGVAHIYAYLAYLISMTLCLAFIPIPTFGAGALAAFALTSALLCYGNAAAFEAVKKEYAFGKTMTSSVKTGYKKCFWQIFDLHIVIALAAFLTFAVALTQLRTFAFLLGIGTLFSGVCVLGVTRFLWAITMSFTRADKRGGFCNFKRTEADDDE